MMTKYENAKKTVASNVISVFEKRLFTSALKYATSSAQLPNKKKTLSNNKEKK